MKIRLLSSRVQIYNPLELVSEIRKKYGKPCKLKYFYIVTYEHTLIIEKLSYYKFSFT